MYRRSPYRRYGGKYSNETTFINCSIDSTMNVGACFPYDETSHLYGVDVVNPSTVMGNRKVKNFTLKFTSNNFTGPVVGCLVYVPQGTNVNTLTLTSEANNLYEPNQNVIANFIIPPSDDSNSTITVSSKLARNLSSNDRICLIFGLPGGAQLGQGSTASVCGTVNFSIKY